MKAKETKIKNYHPKNIFHLIRPYLRDMINDYKTRREWKIQLTMQINIISVRDSKETRTMYTKSRSIEIMMGNEADDIIEEFSKFLLQNYKKDLKEPTRGSRFVSDSIDLFYYHLQKIGLKREGLCIYFPKWLKNKKVTINLENNDDKCF